MTVEGYEVTGPRTDVWVRKDGVVTCFVQRSTGRGRPWLRFVRKFKDSNDAAPPDGAWWVTAYKTKRAATDTRSQ